MEAEPSTQRYRNWYTHLLRLYPKPYYQRFGESMEQTFHDLCRERRRQNRSLFGLALWIFAETSAGMLRENTTRVMKQNKNIVRMALATALL